MQCSKTDVYRHFYRKVVERVRHLYVKPLSLGQVLAFWRDPPIWSQNTPLSYLSGKERTDFLVGLILRFASLSDSILELGCNVGRNLQGLWNVGFRDLYGVDVNRDAVEMCARSGCAKMLFNDALEVCLPTMNRKFDLVFTMATLEHVHSDSASQVFKAISAVTLKCLVTVEDEVGISPTHFARNYKRVFEGLGMRQVESVIPTRVRGLGLNFQARVFKKC